MRSISSGISPKKTMCGRRPPAAGATLHLVQVPINRPMLNRQASALPLAACLGEFAVHVHEADGAGTLVQIVHILRTQEEAVTQLRLQFRQCNRSEERRVGEEGRSRW